MEPPAEGKSPRRRGRPSSANGPLRTRLTIKATDEWDAWLGASAARLGLDKTILIDEALKILAAARGLDPPPSRYHD